MSWTESARALRNIQKNKLYYNAANGVTTFKFYLRCAYHVWGMSDTRAEQMIAALNVAEVLPSDLPKPRCDSFLRPLVKLRPVQQGEVWRMVHKILEENGGERLTRNMVEKVARLHLQCVPYAAAGVVHGTDNVTSNPYLSKDDTQWHASDDFLDRYCISFRMDNTIMFRLDTAIIFLTDNTIIFRLYDTVILAWIIQLFSLI